METSLPMPAAQPTVPPFAVLLRHDVTDHLVSEDELVTGGGHEVCPVAVRRKVKLEADAIRRSRASVAQGRCATATTDVERQVLVDDAPQHLEGRDEIALAGAVGTDQQVESAKADLGMANGEVALDLQGLDLGRHQATLRPADRSPGMMTGWTRCR